MSPRSYDNTGREEQARALRLRVVEAARDLIIERGPIAITIREVALRAGVSPETVYKSFGSKSALIKKVYDVTLAGDDEPRSLAERPQIQEIIAADDGRRKLTLYAALARQLSERLAPLLTKLRAGAAAGDADLRELVSTLDAERLVGTNRIVAHLAETGGLRQGVPVEKGRDILWTLISPELYQLLVIDRGWTPAQYEAWLAQAMIDALAPPQA